MRGTIGLFLSVAIAGAGEASAQGNPASNNNIRTEIVAGYGSTPEQNVYVINSSSELIIVTSIRLIECENVQGSCSTRRMKTSVPAGSRTRVHTVRPRNPDQGFGFRLTFTWEPERPEGPTAADVAKDKTALEVDTVIVAPKILDLKVGETIDLSQVLSLTAKNAAGKVFEKVYFTSRVVLGEDYVTLNGSSITGKAAGTAAISIAANATAVPNPNPKGASQIVVTVTP